MADITYTIGAKDQASAPLAKVGSALDKLERQTKDAADGASKSLTKIGISFGDLAKAAGLIAGVKLAIGGITSLYSAVASGVDDFDAAAESVRQLDQAMELNGGSSEAMVQQYTDLADAIERNTNIAAEDAQALMKQAAVLGVSNDKLDEMTTAAIGVSKALGTSLEDGLKKVMLATEGNFKSFEKLIPSIKNMTTDEEKLAAVMELSARGMAIAEEASHSAAGEHERMQHRIGNLLETVGAAIAPFRELAYKGIALLADGLSNVLTPAVEQSAAFFERWEPVIMGAIERAVNGIIAGLTMGEVIFNNFGAVVGMVIDTIKLKYETYRADTEHLFTVALPTYILWFGDNLVHIMETAWSAAYSVIKNHITKITDSLAAFWDFVKSGGRSDITGKLGEIAGRSYLEGFENSIQSLPQVAARGLTAREQELQASIGKTAEKLATEFDEKFKARAVKLGDGVGQNLADGIDLGLNKAGLAADSAKAAKGGGGGGLTGDLNAVSGRLITRGIGQNPLDIWRGIAKDISAMKQSTEKSEHANLAAASAAVELANLQRDKPVIELSPVGP